MIFLQISLPYLASIVEHYLQARKKLDIGRKQLFTVPRVVTLKLIDLQDYLAERENPANQLNRNALDPHVRFSWLGCSSFC